MELPFLQVNPGDRLMANDKAEYLGKNSASVDSCNLDDTTPSDSGVQMLDSESSELMIESITSQTALELDESKLPVIAITTQTTVGVMDTNSNVTCATDSTMATSQCSTFDNTENIVYRRKTRKPSLVSKTPKKRVSFHEDILKNTRTDNIHIEHGFITYKSSASKLAEQNNGAAVRYSWCCDGDNAEPNELAHRLDSNNKCKRRLVYRNACSDVLDYGNSNVYDINDGNGRLKYDQSGIFEYVESIPNDNRADTEEKKVSVEPELYTCSCSSSDSSLDSDNNIRNRKQYAQAKSNSCDCIGINNNSNNNNNNFIEENCYYSEPNIDCNQSPAITKSVWNKEKKPKSSCLKKNAKYYPNYIVHEQDIRNKMKKFNVHDMNQFLDNGSKMIFGSLKSIFTMTLPERGVPEGSEDLHSVVECVLDCETSTAERTPVTPTTPTMSSSPPLKAKPFLSKSLDGSKQQEPIKKFVHNVDEQLRHKKEEQINTNRQANSLEDSKVINTSRKDESSGLTPFRNKFIINCESTVFEHTGISYSYKSSYLDGDLSCMEDGCGSLTSLIESNSNSLENSLLPTPLTTTFTNFFRNLKDTSRNKISHMQAHKKHDVNESRKPIIENAKPLQLANSSPEKQSISKSNLNSSTGATSICEFSSSNGDDQKLNTSLTSGIGSITSSQRESISNVSDLDSSRHLPSPLRKPSFTSSYSTKIIQSSVPQRYSNTGQSYLLYKEPIIDYNISDSKNTTSFSEEFDDIITITTDTDRNGSDIVIVDYPEHNDYNNLLKAPSSTSKASLINRFLRNVTQKKILETSIKRNNFFATKLKSQQKLLGDNLYIKGAKVMKPELIDDLNAEIAIEIELNSPSKELKNLENDLTDINSHSPDNGLGEIPIDLFNRIQLNILQEANEHLVKAYKLYTGYSREGYMTPVLVFLSDRMVYVCDLVRSRLCSKFMLAYSDLDIILLGPYGSTVLLSNNSRDKQQILLAGGYQLANELVANLELCTRRNNCDLAAVGELNLDHLTALRKFINKNSSVGRDDNWMLYTIVNIPGSSLEIEGEQEPMGPHAKGFLMHRRFKDQLLLTKYQQQSWSPGYFLLKAGVLYMFNDSTQKIPSWAMALAECQGARRAAKINRPHCFEIVLKDHILLQLAAPDEYVASEWLQALLQSASGLFEMQEKHKTLGCTLILTKNHLITLREDFSSPLKPVCNKVSNEVSQTLQDETYQQMLHTSSLLSSAMSTPTRSIQRSSSSINSTPTKLSLRSNTTCNTTITSPSLISHITLTSNTSSTTINTCCSQQQQKQQQQARKMYEQCKNSSIISSSNLFSIYGENAGLEILTCADIKELTGLKISSHHDACWCILEFSCQEVRESSDDLVIFFSTSTEKQEFLRLFEQLWQAKNKDMFPVSVIDECDELHEQCTALNIDIKRSWEPLLSAAFGYPL